MHLGLSPWTLREADMMKSAGCTMLVSSPGRFFR